MFKTEEALLDALLIRKNQTLGTENLRKALAFFDNPHLKLKTIQIGGTNGKGSTSYYLSHLLPGKIGLFTSPHLMTHRDRISIDHAMISVEDFLYLANKTYPLWERYQLSMFEIDFLIASLYFLDHGVDYAIFEVGLGGRLDASNLLYPQVQAITNVSLDHMHLLGDTLEAIANEKAAIFKENIPVFTCETKPEVLKVFDTWAKKQHTQWQAIDPIHCEKINQGYDVSFKRYRFHLENEASYQIQNVSLALSIAEYLCGPIDDVQNKIQNAKWKGRFEWLTDSILIDGAHNEAGIKRLLESLEIYKDQRWTILYAGLRDKDYELILDMLSSYPESFYVTSFDFPRALKKDDLLPYHDVYIDNWKQFIDNHREGKLLITGSLYFISEVRSYLLDNKKN